MIAWDRVMTVAETQARDLLRRRIALAMLLLLPAAMYLTVLEEEAQIRSGENPFTLRVGVVGVAWAVAGAAFFLGLSSRRVDERLTLTGYRRGDLAAGRLLFLSALAAAVMVLYCLLITGLSRGDAGIVTLAVISTGIVALGLGLALATLVPRELEGVLALIALIGIQTSLPTDAAIGPALPFYGPTRLVEAAWNSSGSVVAPLLHAGAAAIALLGLFLALWGRRLAR
jgi:hypothetical protein